MERGTRICVDVDPAGDSRVFRSRAADTILRLLVDAHETEYTIPELVDETEAARSTVWRAVTLLSEIGAVRVRKTPQRNYVSVDPERLQKDDPILTIQQTEFHEPIRTFVNRVQAVISSSDDVEELLGVVVFGSVARGDADRQSDIDLFVLVEGDRTSARRLITEEVADLREERFGGERFDFEPFVESGETARRAGSKLAEIFDEGVTIRGSEPLHELRKEVVSDE
jgi:predicted nucleotidyltransferase